ncbi:hypothetical protein CAPTEDRAFT_211194 [Capitella teleta]|uniref:Uncharacterized protein n=1 Tax=Capitella teleta TaxID=283909 RepID=R7UJ04_CAPTE|nr:hypothetical protein CAPTEDRAFT_211194 [Capitella teleta]|eukprot:ELU06170.1 hypothetical protein CAPTEDRAFT_211194 [Capitella teleta]
MYDNIVKACLDAAEGTVGRKRKRRGNTPLRRPWWKDHVEPHRDRAIFWHALWKSSGSPHDGHVADIRQRTRARYRYAVRYVKRHEEQCRANKLAEALAKDRGRDIWNEVQKISGRKTNRVAMVDGMVDDRDIGELFARKNIRGFGGIVVEAVVVEVVKVWMPVLAFPDGGEGALDEDRILSLAMTSPAHHWVPADTIFLFVNTEAKLVPGAGFLEILPIFRNDKKI